MEVRLFQPEDTEQIAQLFYDTVRNINIRDYTVAQIIAWSPTNFDWRNWLKVCTARFTYVATEGEEIVGFGELEANGHIDCFYIHYQYQRRGVGSRIYKTIETKAKELSLIRLYVEASITAKPFFIRQGFEIISPQQVFCRGEILTNYLMEKKLYY